MMPTYGEWQPGLVHDYEKVFSGSDANAPAAAGYLTPDPHGHDVYDAAASGARGAAETRSTASHIADDPAVSRATFEDAWQAQANTDGSATARPELRYKGAEGVTGVQSPPTYCSVSWTATVMTWKLFIPSYRLDDQGYRVAPPSWEWPENAIGVQYHPEDTRITYLDAKVTDFKCTTWSGPSKLALRLFAKAPGSSGPVVDATAGMEGIFGLPSLPEDPMVPLPLNDSMNNYYGPDHNNPAQQLHVYIAATDWPGTSGHVDVSWSFSPWWVMRVQYRTARYRYVFADPPAGIPRPAHIRIVQRGSDGLGLSGGKRVIQGRSQQSTSRRGAGFH